MTSIELHTVQHTSFSTLYTAGSSLIFQVIKSIATALRDNDEGINSQMLCNMKANKSSELPKTSDKVMVCSDSNEPELEEQLSQQNLSEERVISAGDSTSSPDVKTGDPEKQSSSSEEMKETCLNCNECRIKRRDPSPKELSMCLHAAVYKVQGYLIIIYYFTFNTKLTVICCYTLILFKEIGPNFFTEV